MQQELEKLAEINRNGRAAAEPGFVAAGDVGGTNLRLALADMAGTILTRWSGSTAGLRGPEAVVQLISTGVNCMLHDVAASQDSLRSIAIGIPGIADVDNGIVFAASYLAGWKNVPLRALLEKELNVSAVIDNDVNMAALGELACGSAKNARDFVFLAIGTGIGSGIVLNGKLHRGSSWAAGEIGYMLVPGADQMPVSSDDPGALEKMIGGVGIKTQWKKLTTAHHASPSKEINATEIFDRALEGDADAQKLLTQSATMLAQTIYNISLVLDCPLFVMGGTVGLHAGFCEATRGILDKWTVPGSPKLVRSTLGTDAQLLGCVSAALEAARAQV